MGEKLTTPVFVSYLYTIPLSLKGSKKWEQEIQEHPGWVAAERYVAEFATNVQWRLKACLFKWFIISKRAAVA